jgi:uroporphyrinogen decarboxylase
MDVHQRINMTGKELLLAAMRHEPVPAAPWVPFAGVHAGKLKGYTATEVLQDGSKLLESLLAVNELYDPDGQPVIFDLQVEAELLGCELVWAPKAPPSVVTHPLGSSLARIPDRLPGPDEGRLPMILDVMRAMKKAVGHKTGLYGLVCGPFTLASHLRGTEIFMDMYDNPDELRALLAYTSAVSMRIANYYIKAGMDIIAIVDPLVSQISPRHFRSFLFEPFRDIFAWLHMQGVFSSFFVCGDATKNIEIMCQTGPDCISIDENIDLLAAAQITGRYNVTLAGNIPLTTRMLLGTQQDNMKFVVDLLDAVHSHSELSPQNEPGQTQYKNFILSPGCDMPYDTPPENVVGVLQAVRDPEAARLMLASYQAHGFDLPVDLPDYGSLPRPLVEVFTLDSDTCAACGYMLGAAQRAVAELAARGTAVDLVEYKFTRAENVARVIKMGIQKLPSLYINGQLKYSSVIPSNRELLEQICTSIS